MNIKEKIYTETICFRTTPELKELFFHAQALDKAKFTRILTEVCNKLIKSSSCHDVIRDNHDVIRDEENSQDVIRDENSRHESKSTAIHDVIRDKKSKSKKTKVVEKSVFEQVKAERAEYESKHNINSLF